MKLYKLLLLITVFPLQSNSEEFALNPRAVQCKFIQYSELESMDQTQLQAALCGYRLGNKLSEKKANAVADDKQSNNDSTGLATKRLKEIPACNEPQITITDLLKTKYPAAIVDCNRFKDYEALMSK